MNTFLSWLFEIFDFFIHGMIVLIIYSAAVRVTIDHIRKSKE